MKSTFSNTVACSSVENARDSAFWGEFLKFPLKNGQSNARRESEPLLDGSAWSWLSDAARVEEEPGSDGLPSTSVISGKGMLPLAGHFESDVHVKNISQARLSGVDSGDEQHNRGRGSIAFTMLNMGFRSLLSRIFRTCSRLIVSEWSEVQLTISLQVRDSRDFLSSANFAL
jgi:hypothetical protein